MKVSIAYILPFLFCVAPTSLAVADGPVAVPVDGDRFHGKLVAADSTGTLAFETDEGTRDLSVADLVRWGVCTEPDRAPVFVLRDGTLLPAGILETSEKELTLDSESLGLLRVPREQLAGVVFRLPASRLERDRLLDEAGRNTEETSQIVMLNGDRLRGELVAFDDRKVSFRTPVGAVDFEVDRISSLSLPSTAREEREPCTLVGLADGTRICARQISIADGSATASLPCGLVWKGDAAEVVFLQPASSRIAYLSDLTPTGYRHVPYLDRTWDYENDRNVLGGLLRCTGRLYLKGLGMHTAARITYAPPAGTERFDASVGIDDGTDGLGSVRFRVFVDGEERYVSGTARGLEPPTPISVDSRGASRVDLVVDFADRADVQDHANWLDARFVLGK